MKAVVDDKIPYIHEAIEALMDDVVYLPGKKITAIDVRDADVLIVRTRTRCDRRLLEGSRVRFIATATIGFDHIDTAYLAEAGITWTNCPGCNANSVGQYVRNCLFLLEKERGIDLASATLGIVGVGHVGKAVLKAVRPYVGRILLNDPPRQEAGDAEADMAFSTLADMARECDILTLHTPLITDGNHPTYHLVDEALLQSLRRQPVIINAGRGEVVDNAALEAALEAEQVSDAIIDTWEGEPALRLSLLEKVLVGTPHIAGYSADGKANATRMSIEALCRWMGREMTFTILPPSLPYAIRPTDDPIDLALQYYNPLDDSARLKASPSDFERLRGDYPIRRES